MVWKSQGGRKGKPNASLALSRRRCDKSHAVWQYIPLDLAWALAFGAWTGSIGNPRAPQTSQAVLFA